MLPHQDDRLRRRLPPGRPQGVPRAPRSNKIFIALANPPQTNYRETFAQPRRKLPLEPSCKPSQKYSPAPHRLKYKTEYNDEFVGQRIHHRPDFECLSREELKQYVMNILQE